MSFDYDLFVIGAGSGGVRAARRAALTGAKVGIAEEYRFGGTCVIRGCVPKKLMVYAAQYHEHFEDSRGYGWHVEGEPRFAWPEFFAHKEAEIARLEGLYHKGLSGNGVEIHACRAELTGPHDIKLANGQTLSAKHILIATGGRPFLPRIPGIEHAITSNEFFGLTQQPKRVLLVGGGYIASEFAFILNGLGSTVSQHYRGELILRGFDHDVRESVMKAMQDKGIILRTNCDVAEISRQEDGLHVLDGHGIRSIHDAVVYATGRRPNTADLGLETAGVELTGSGAIKVDAYSRTNVPSIYAVGDVTDRLQLTPVAIHEAMCFVQSVFHGQPVSPDHELVPTAVFTQPEIGTVGLTEDQARETHEVEIYRTRFRAMVHVMAKREERMLMKIIVDKPSRKVLGVHIVGHGAGDMIQCLGIAVKMGATKDDFDRTMAVHPVAAEELVTLYDPVAEA